MSDDRPKRDTMSLEEATISNMWEIAACSYRRTRHLTISQDGRTLTAEQKIIKTKVGSANA